MLKHNDSRLLLSEHTPGPWTYEPEDYSIDRVRSRNGLVAEVVGDSAEAQANAKLIALAPDLIEGCKSLLDAIHLDETYRSHWDSKGNRMFRAAIGLINNLILSLDDAGNAIDFYRRALDKAKKE